MRDRDETIRENCLRCVHRRSFPQALQSVSVLLARFLSSTIHRAASPPRFRLPDLQYHASRNYQASIRRRRLPEAIQTSSTAHTRCTTSRSVSPTASALTSWHTRDPRADSNDRHRTKLANPDKRDGLYATNNLQFAKVDARQEMLCV